MSVTDLSYIFHWWVTFFTIGIFFLPLITFIFSSFFDKGYIFGKILGISIISYCMMVLGIAHILAFTNQSLLIIIALLGIINIVLFVKKKIIFLHIKNSWRIFLVEELLFFLGIFSWSFVRNTQPDIHGLEKFMDFGFVNSVLRSTYFPPKDMWYTSFPINYYYFGHLTTAMLTKLSEIPSSVSFNLMIATLFSFTFVGSFSLGLNFFLSLLANAEQSQQNNRLPRSLRSLAMTIEILIPGLLTAFLTAFAGNLHTIYTLFKPYENENPIPFWQLVFSPQTFPNSYWYPNATRFIYHTIHEFPLYSFVVSDLHGHVLDIPLVLLTIAVLFVFITKSQITNHKSQTNSKSQNMNSIVFNFNSWSVFEIWNLKFGILTLIGFLLAIMYMTNVWDGIIYFMLTFGVIFYLEYKRTKNLDLSNINLLIRLLVSLLITATFFLVFSLPFSAFFKPFASQIGVLCAPAFLTSIGHFGPFLFEPTHCQHSPLWQLAVLYGFFYFWVSGFLIFLVKIKKKQWNTADIFVLLIIFLSTILIIIPEFVYLKDIYPAHYRANTMFKLVYQSFIMLSLASGYIIVRMVFSIKYLALRIKGKILTTCYLLLATFLLLAVAVYPFFAITSYYGTLQTSQGLDGTTYLGKLYRDDYIAINWLNVHVKGQPVILEAQGDSYTDYARVSSNTGLPTVLGWTVHEWLWRGSYNPLPERISNVQTLYETNDIQVASNLIKKYHISLVFVGNLERQKYPTLNEIKFFHMGKLIFSSNTTHIFSL